MSASLAQPDDTSLHLVIHGAAAAAAAVGAGMAQLPVDAPALATIQAVMIQALGAEFGVRPSQQTIAEILLPFMATMAGRQASRWLLAFLPGIGNAANAATAAALTEAVGWAAVEHFRRLR